MSVYGGSIGPRMPKMDGENCGNCGGVFVMLPGYTTNQEDGIRYGHWKCAQCNAEQSWAVGRDPSWVAPEAITEPQEEAQESETYKTPVLPGQLTREEFME